jgi:predicted O-methyltransferase YrrM
MRLAGLLDAELGRLRGRLGRRQLRILETGSIRADTAEYETGDGWSTLHFARQVAEHGGTFTSVDLDTSVAVRVLDALGVAGYVDLVQADSIDLLAGLVAAWDRARLDVAYLDSDNDAGLILHEFLLVRRLLNSPGLLLVDDVDLDSATVVKGHKLVPWLNAAGVPFRVERRDGGAGVLVADL